MFFFSRYCECVHTHLSVIKFLSCLSQTQSKSAKSVQTLEETARAVNVRKMTLNASTCLQFASSARQTTKATVVPCCFGRRQEAGGKVITWIFWSRLRRSEAPISQGGNLQGQTIKVTVVDMLFKFSNADRSQIAIIKWGLFRVGWRVFAQNLMLYQKVSAVGVQ